MPITSVKLKESVLAMLKVNTKAKTMLAYNTNKSYPTIERWVRFNSEYLTMSTALKTISDELQIPVADLTEEIN